jgi:hypothetical protein
MEIDFRVAFILSILFISLSVVFYVNDSYRSTTLGLSHSDLHMENVTHYTRFVSARTFSTPPLATEIYDFSDYLRKSREGQFLARNSWEWYDSERRGRKQVYHDSRDEKLTGLRYVLNYFIITTGHKK